MKQEGAPSLCSLERRPSRECSGGSVCWQKALVTRLRHRRPQGGNRALSADEQGAGGSTGRDCFNLWLAENTLQVKIRI